MSITPVKGYSGKTTLQDSFQPARASVLRGLSFSSPVKHEQEKKGCSYRLDCLKPVATVLTCHHGTIKVCREVMVEIQNTTHGIEWKVV